MMIPKGLGGVRKRRNIAKTVGSIAKCAKDCLVSESSSQGVKGLNGAKIFEIKMAAITKGPIRVSKAGI